MAAKTQLPHIDEAQFPLKKASQFLCNPAHPQNKGRAVVFLGYGFRADQPEQMRDAFLAHARGHPATVIPSQHGIKYKIDGSLVAPDGRLLRVRAIWIIETGQSAPAFVTATPRKRRR